LSQGDAFRQYFKFKNSMTKALEKGLVLPDDLSPRAALDRAAEAGMLSSDPPPRPILQLEQNKLNMRDVGHSSYDKLGRPGLSPEEQFKAMCRHRSRFARDDPLPSRGLHLMHSADQERRIFNVTARDFSIGAMLDGALLINAGKRHAARTINLLGESEGVACIVNDPKRSSAASGHTERIYGVPCAELTCCQRRQRCWTGKEGSCQANFRSIRTSNPAAPEE
jgi:hypothetical protein